MQALPLARTVFPALELEDWRDYTHQHIRPPTSGLVGVQDDHGYFHGLFGYRVRREVLGATLDVEWAAAINLLERSEAAATLVREIETVAAQLDCPGVQVRLLPGQRRLRRWLERNGHSLAGVILEKPLPPTRHAVAHRSHEMPAVRRGTPYLVRQPS